MAPKKVIAPFAESESEEDADKVVSQVLRPKKNVNKDGICDEDDECEEDDSIGSPVMETDETNNNNNNNNSDKMDIDDNSEDNDNDDDTENENDNDNDNDGNDENGKKKKKRKKVKSKLKNIIKCAYCFDNLEENEVYNATLDEWMLDGCCYMDGKCDIGNHSYFNARMEAYLKDENNEPNKLTRKRRDKMLKHLINDRLSRKSQPVMHYKCFLQKKQKEESGIKDSLKPQINLHHQAFKHLNDAFGHVLYFYFCFYVFFCFFFGCAWIHLN